MQCRVSHLVCMLAFTSDRLTGAMLGFPGRHHGETIKNNARRLAMLEVGDGAH